MRAGICHSVSSHSCVNFRTSNTSVCKRERKAKRNSKLLDLSNVRGHRAEDFWEPVTAEAGGARTTYPAEHVISSMPMPHLLLAMNPPVPERVMAAAKGLQFRDFLTVALVIPRTDTFDDNWIYIHAPEVQVGRIQNFGSWSPYLVKDGRTCLGLEYFVFEGDERKCFLAKGEIKKLANLLRKYETDLWFGAVVLMSAGEKKLKGQPVMGMVVKKAAFPGSKEKGPDDVQP